MSNWSLEPQVRHCTMVLSYGLNSMGNEASRIMDGGKT